MGRFESAERAGRVACGYPMGTLDGRLIALDGEMGKPCRDFGSNGRLSLTKDVALAPEWQGGYQVTSAPAIFENLVIVGSSIADNWKVDTERGIVRAYDARTGKLRWTWNPTQWAVHDQTSNRGRERLVHAVRGSGARSGLRPTGSPRPDYYERHPQGRRQVGELRGVVAPSSGDFVWGFQMVHHNLWDYDVAAQPTLMTGKDGTPAVVINTKMGDVFVLDRLNGAPLLPLEERPVPRTDIPGEESWPTQPFSTISLVPTGFAQSDTWGQTTADVQWCQEKVKASRSEGIFTRPSLKGSIVFPGKWVA